MRFSLNTLNALSLADIKEKFSKIPLYDNVLELFGDFNLSVMAKCKVSPCLEFLPAHVNELVLNGAYSFSIESVNENSNDTYRAIWRMHLGRQFFLLVGAIPRNILTLKIIIQRMPAYEPHDPIISDVALSLGRCFESLSEHIDCLDLSGMVAFGTDEHDNLWKMYRSIPNTVQKLYPHQMNWHYLTDEHREKMLRAASGGLLAFALENQDIFSSSVKSFRNFFQAISPDVMGFSLAHCNIGRQSLESILPLFQTLGSNIVGLNLKNNNLHMLDADLPKFFKALPANLAYLDISQNNLLKLPNSLFIERIDHLPKKINTLKIYENSLEQHHLAAVADNFASLPANILVLGFAGGRWMGLTINQFMWAIHRLSPRVFCIDYSDNHLYQLGVHDFQQLVTFTPPHVKKLVLKRNNLIAYSAEDLREIFSRIPFQIREIDFSENGFDRLPASQLNVLLDALPNIFINFGHDKIMRRNDGRLLPFPWRPDDEYFKRIGLVYHQRDLSSFFLLIHQFIKQKKLPESFIIKLIASLWPSYPRKIIENMVKKSALFIGLNKRLDAEEFSENLTRRVDAQKQHSNFDLSHAALKHIDTVSQYQQLFAKIPEKALRVNLRCNGIAMEESALKSFTLGIKYLPAHVSYVDLSGNLFEHLPFELLHHLLINIPASIKLLSLTTERPVSVVDHIARLQDVPAYFHKLIKNEDNIFKKLLILLRDYTLDDSWFRRLIFGYWNRQNIPEIRRLMFIINSHQLTEFGDIMDYLQSINMPNDQGALAKSMSLIFREHQKSLPSPRDALSKAPH